MVGKKEQTLKTLVLGVCVVGCYDKVWYILIVDKCVTLVFNVVQDLTAVSILRYQVTIFVIYIIDLSTVYVP